MRSVVPVGCFAITECLAMRPGSLRSVTAEKALAKRQWETPGTNEIIVRGRPLRRFFALTILVGMTAVFLLPLFHQFECETARTRWKCEAYNTAGPFFAPLCICLIFVTYRRFLFGQPTVALGREGIDVCIYRIGTVRWTDIEDVTIERIGFAKTLVIRGRLPAPPPRSGPLGGVMSILLDPNPKSGLQVSPAHIDRPMEHLRHWIDQGRRHAARGESPDPFFTVPY